MSLHDFFSAEAIDLGLHATDRAAALAAAVGLLHLDTKSAETLLRVLTRREQMGSTGMGRGIAIPHCRSLVVPRLRMAYARLAEPLPWEAIDGKPVRHVFLIVAPPLEVSNQYLPTLGQLAGFAKEPGNIERLEGVKTAGEFLELFGTKKS
ncbi:MAG: PTS sugar transporter subunit IIA [Gemmatimonadales bacterium]|nr:PTS sugar transporter subunit IIA [Gemmatimonadales bacterium]